MKNTSTKFYLAAASLALALSAGAQSVNSNMVDKSPFDNPPANYNPTPQSPWQILFNYNLQSITGLNGNAGVCITPQNEIWVSRWGSDTISNITLAGTLISKFTIAGVTGVRSLTSDGTSLYAGQNTSTIAKINPVNKTLVTNINAPIANVRSLTYDPTANSNAGGFWMSTWATDIQQSDLMGNATSGIVPATSHLLTAMYGTVWDGTSPGGPYLWVFNQNSSSNYNDIVILNIASGTQIGIVHDAFSDVGVAASLTAGSTTIAGGLFMTPSPMTLTGVIQGSPTNQLFNYDVAGVVSGMFEHPDFNSAFLGVYPNPATDLVNIAFDKNNNDAVRLQIVNAVGQLVFDRETRGKNNFINVSQYKAGVYFVKAVYDGKVYTSKLIKQ